MVSWAAVDKMTERTWKIDPKLKKMLAEKPMRSSAITLTDDELLQKLNSLGVVIDRSSLERLCESSLSGQQIAESFLVNRTFKNDKEETQSDWIWICLTELWKRWFPDKLCFELIDDKMQDGYDLMHLGNDEAACDIWLETWSLVLALFDKANIKSIEDYDHQFGGTQFLSNWLNDLEMELWNAGLNNPKYLTERISISQAILERFYQGRVGKEHDDTIGNFKRALADSHFSLGETEIAEALYRKWLEDDEKWGWGWIGWSDHYLFGHPSAKDLGQAEFILRQGLSISEIRDRQDLEERLVGVLEKQGRKEEAKELERQIKARASVTRSTRAFLAGNSWREKNANDVLLQISKTDKRLGATTKVPTKVPSVGRKEPCPCGSGSKYKRCCGSGR